MEDYIMSKYLDIIHDTFGNFTDESDTVEKAACELAMKLDWYYNSQSYRDAANELIPKLTKIVGAQYLCDNIANKITNNRPFDVDAIREIVNKGTL
jgi:hypothetical protein